MAAAKFVHLHVHTYYSLLDGANPIGVLANRAKEFGMPAVAMTDHGNLFGAIEFYQKMTASAIQPILGCEAYVMPEGDLRDRTSRGGGEEGLRHLTLLARNFTGYQNLCRLSSVAHLEGFYYKPRIDKPTLAAHAEGIIALTGCLNGEICKNLLGGNFAKAKQLTEWLMQTFGEESVFIEIMRHNLPDQAIVNPQLLELARQCSRPLVATNDCHYCGREHAASHDALLCIQTGKEIADVKRMRMDSDQFYFRSPDEMGQIFSDLPAAISQTVDVAKLCHVEIDFKTYHFPKFDAPAGKSLDTLLGEQAREGLNTRWSLIQKTAGSNAAADLRQQYDDRLQMELECINTMGFAGYFLIVADFIQHAKSEGIPVGPGRGSAAGSLVAYCLRITDVDPIPFKLFFERFLNPERISMPDMDIDFCMRRREEVIAYVQKKYGNVGQIITFGKMKAKAAIRDVARVMAIPYGDADRLSKLVPNTIGITLKEAMEQEPQLSGAGKSDERIAQLLTVAQELEGFPRHASTHAAGVVISDRPLTDFLPLYRGANGETVTQYDMKAVESIGLIKFDFLGLKTLTILYDAIDLITARHGVTLRLEEIPLTDPKIFELFSAGDTSGVFQLESSGMTDLVQRLKPTLFEDIVALVALFRPGPMDWIPEYIRGKHDPSTVKYPHPLLEAVCRETYGVMVYQEQVMEAARIIGGYTLGGADMLRRAMGKKNTEAMAKERGKFVAGAKALHQIDEKTSNAIFDILYKFAGYGFNKSHSVAYALVSYHTAYFKAHYPVEFFAALLTNEMGNQEKVLEYLADAKVHGITILPPDVNHCARDFQVVDDRTIRFGLAAVKNVGDGAIEAIVAARNAGGHFTSLFDYCARVDARTANRRVIESLIKCGAFDSLGAHRATLWATVDTAVEYGARRQKDAASGQESLFGELTTGQIDQPHYVTAPEWNETEQLTFEKESLGFYITGHPLSQYAELIQGYTNARTSTVRELGDRKPARIAGIIAGSRELLTKRGDKMAFLTIEDLYGTIEVVVFADLYAKSRALLATDQAICITGLSDVNDEAAKLIANDISLLADTPQKLTKAVRIRIAGEKADPELLGALSVILQRFPGGCQVRLQLVQADGSETILALPPTLRIMPSLECLVALQTLCGPNVLKFEVAPPTPPPDRRRTFRAKPPSGPQSVVAVTQPA